MAGRARRDYVQRRTLGTKRPQATLMIDASPELPIPLITPDVGISHIRLSDSGSRLRPREAARTQRRSSGSQPIIRVRVREAHADRYPRSPTPTGPDRPTWVSKVESQYASATPSSGRRRDGAFVRGTRSARSESGVEPPQSGNGGRTWRMPDRRTAVLRLTHQAVGPVAASPAPWALGRWPYSPSRSSRRRCCWASDRRRCFRCEVCRPRRRRETPLPLERASARRCYLRGDPQVPHATRRSTSISLAE